MTPHEIRALDFIRERIAATACAPTLQEIAHELGFAAKSTAARIVDSLVWQGHLIRDPHKARNLRLTDTPPLTAVPTEALLAELARRGGVFGESEFEVVTC